MAAARRRVPALIVGGGPVGLYSSALLSAYGVPSLLAERSTSPSTHPRAHLINSRSMELLRELGVEPAIRQLTPPLDEWRHFRYCTSLIGPQIAAQDHTAGAPWARLCEAATTQMAHLSQPKLEAILRAEAERRAPDGGGELAFGYELARFERRAGGGVRAELRRTAEAAATSTCPDGQPDSLEVEADALLGCDGAHSGVRRALGLQLRGPPPLQHFKSVHFTAPELAPLLAHSPAMLHFVFSRDVTTSPTVSPTAPPPRHAPPPPPLPLQVIGVLVAHNLAQGEWVAQLPFFPGLQDASALDRQACAAAIGACIGGGGGAGEAAAAVPFEVHLISPRSALDLHCTSPSAHCVAPSISPPSPLYLPFEGALDRQLGHER